MGALFLGPARRDRALYAIGAAAAVAGACLIYLVDPREPGNYPRCWFLYLTGCYCPGCGALRSMHQLLHGDIVSALGYNPYVMLLLPALLYYFGSRGLAAYGVRRLRRPRLSATKIRILLAAIIAFWVLRNLPFEPFSILAP